MTKTGYIFILFVLNYIYFNTAPSIGQENANHTGLSFWVVGGEQGKIKRFGKNFSPTFRVLKKNKDELDCILLAIAEQPLTEKQILERCALAPSRVRYFISNLSSIQLIKYNKDRWATTIPVITDKEMKIIKEDLTPLAYMVSQYIGNEVAQIKQLYAKAKSPLDPSWEDLAHLVIDKFLVDGSFLRAIGTLERDKGIRDLYNQSQQYLPAFFLERGDNFSTFGTNWYPFKRSDQQREVYVLHGALLDRFDILLNKYEADQNLSSALFKITPENAIHSFTNVEKEILTKLHWIAEDSLLVPTINATTIKSLLPVIDGIAKNAAEIVFENYSTITSSFNNSTYFKFLNAGGDYIQVCYHTLFCVIIEQLVAADILPPIPEPVPEYFGVFIILGKLF